MSEQDVCTNLKGILQLLEYLSSRNRCESIGSQLKYFLFKYSKQSLRVLEKARQIRPEWIDENLLISCFCAYEVTGDLLISEVRRAKLPPKYFEVSFFAVIMHTLCFVKYLFLGFESIYCAQF